MDKEARSEMLRIKATGVPTFLIGQDLVIGLDRDKILSLVDHRLVECVSCHKKVRLPTNKTNIIAKCPNCKNILSL